MYGSGFWLSASLPYIVKELNRQLVQPIAHLLYLLRANPEFVGFPTRPTMLSTQVAGMVCNHSPWQRWTSSRDWPGGSCPQAFSRRRCCRRQTHRQHQPTDERRFGPCPSPGHSHACFKGPGWASVAYSGVARRLYTTGTAASPPLSRCRNHGGDISFGRLRRRDYNRSQLAFGCSTSGDCPGLKWSTASAHNKRPRSEVYSTKYGTRNGHWHSTQFCLASFGYVFDGSGSLQFNRTPLAACQYGLVYRNDLRSCLGR